MKKTLSVLLSILMVVGTVSCCFGVTAAAADDVIAFRYDALGFTADENGLAANIDFGKNIIRGFDVGVEGYGDYISAGKEGLYPLFETGSAIGTGDRVKVTTEQGNAETAVADYETVVYGDLDGDGYLDVLDAVLVERISTGAYAPTESDFADGGMSYAAFVEAADVNGDGQINALDYSALVDAALGGAEIDQHRVEASWVENVHSEIETQVFTGIEITPDFDVDLCGKLLDADSDYDVTFSENIEIGEAYITIFAKKASLYSGEKTFTFAIKSIIEIVCRDVGKMLEECGIDDCISVSYDAENAAVDVIFDGDALLALELNPDRTALTGVYSELMSLFGKIYAARKLTVDGVTVGENGVKNYEGINELKNELRNALRSFENAEENLVKSFDGVIASETVSENFKVNVKFNCSDADALCGGLAALDGFVAFGADELDPELTVIDVNIPEAFARELAAEYEDIYGAVEGFGAIDVNTFIGKFAGLETTDIAPENGSVINMFADAFGKMNILVTDILAGRDIQISADGSEYINAYNGNAFNSENGSTADVGSFIAAIGELADLESVNASAFSDGRGDYCVYVKVGYADSEYVKNYKLNLNVFGTLVDELENSACDYTALTNAINNTNTVLSGGTAYTSASLAVVNEKLTAANGVPAGLLKGVNCENQKLIDDTAQELNLAVAALINKADYTALENAKTAAAAKKNDGKVYTAESMAALDSALNTANGISGDLSVDDQQTVDNAAAAINNAIAALVEYVEPTDVNNIAVKFPNVDKFLYRVGNMNTVALSSLFEATGEVNSADVVLTVTTVEGTAACTYTANTTAWQNGTVKFTGEGVVKVSIKHNKAAATELYLEVVNAKNATTAQSATSNDVVLLNDVSSSGGFSVSGNHIFYGNGFKVSDTRTNTSGTQGFVTLNKARLDNVEIVGLEYPETVLFGAENQYYSPCVNIGGDTEIYNCHISGCRFAVQIGGGNVIIENSLIEGGTNANIALNSGALTLKNSITSKSRNNTLQGLGIVVGNRNAKLNIEGTFKQYNWLTSSQIPSAYSSILKDMYNDSSFAYSSGGTKYVNMGVLFYNSDDTIGIAVAEDMLNDLTANSYGFKEKTVSGITGTAYTEKSAGITDADVGCCEYSTAGQYYTLPITSFDYTSKNYIAKTADSNKYCYYDSALKKVNISFESTDGSFAWDPMIFTASKYGTSYNYTVSMNGVDYTNRNIVFTASGDYEVVYTYTDTNSYSMVDGVLAKGSKVYENTVYITVSAVDPEISAYHPQFTYASGAAAKKTIISNNTYIMPDVTGASATVGSTTVGGQTVYFPIVTVGPTSSNGNTAYSSGKGYYFAPAFSELNITDYNQSTGAVQYTYNSSSKTWPHGKSAKDGPDAAVFGYDSGAAYANQPYGRSTDPRYYGFGSNNKGLCYTCNEIEKDNAASQHLVKYHYVGNDGTTYYYYIKYSFTAMTYESCFATGTLITLADGSQKKIEDITFGDKILAWDFFTGTYVEKEISLLVYHGDDTYVIANTVYSDGTVLRTIAEHGVFDYDLNKFVYITAANCTDYIGHRFVKYNSNGSYDIVTMTDAYVTTEVTGAYSISSAGTSNAIAEGLLTVAPPEDFYNWIEMDGKLHYDVEQFNADVEKYGLYDYEVFSDYVTYEQFVAFNGAYLKIPVEKGLFTFDYIIDLINLYSQWMPE